MAPNSDPLIRAQTHLASAKRIVFFTGAGMSAESGIPTFRDALTGLWEHFDPEQLATPQGFLHDPSLVWGWYEWRRMRALQALPNAGHLAIADFAAQHRECSPDVTINVITQNVDNLHDRAGSIDVTHLHGSLFAHRCFRCASPARAEDIAETPDEPEGGRRIDPPRCRRCADLIRPGVVWVGEALPKASFDHATALIDECDVLVVVGTSGVVQPAAGLVGDAIAMNKTVIVVDPGVSAWQQGACICAAPLHQHCHCFSLSQQTPHLLRQLLNLVNKWLAGKRWPPKIECSNDAPGQARTVRRAFPARDSNRATA